MHVKLGKAIKKKGKGVFCFFFASKECSDLFGHDDLGLDDAST
jgi:hypothetical protein